MIIMGDLNDVVCEGRRVSSVVGNYGLDDRGKMLIDLCTRNKLCIMNSWLKNPERRRYTWKSPGDRRTNINWTTPWSIREVPKKREESMHVPFQEQMLILTNDQSGSDEDRKSDVTRL